MSEKQFCESEARTGSRLQTRFELKGNRTSNPVQIDGVMQDAEWQQAVVAGDFLQYEPLRGKHSDVKTRVFVLYDSEHLYVAFQACEPEEPTAQLTRRDDDLLNDDSVIVLLDTYNDRRSAYYFMTNPLGTQTDGKVADDGRTVDPTWDAPWMSEARHTEYGWSVEMMIPFTSIKYASGEGTTWGINFGRSRRKSFEISFWAGPLDDRFRLSQAGRLVDLNIPSPVRRHQMIPFGLSQMQKGQHGKWDAGFDYRYSLNPAIAAYATVNPDFATIEADQEQINLTRFELLLKEKRQFFIEGNELFQQRIQTFYSRRIPDINVGSKLLGKQGPWNLAFLATYSELAEESEDAAFAVARTQRDILGSSNIAFMLANRYWGGGNHGSASMDTTLFFSKTFGMTAQAVKSYGEFNSGTWGYFLRPAYDSPTAHFHVRFTHLGNHFADNINAIGFVSDDNRRELDSAYEKKFLSAQGPFEKTVYDSNYNIYWGQDGELRSWQIDQELEFELRNRFSIELSHTEEFKRFEKDFRNRKSGLEIGYNTRQFQSMEMEFEFGRNFDSDFLLWTSRAGYKIGSPLSVEYALQRLILHPDPRNESTWIHVLSATQFFTKDLFLKFFFQSNAVIDRRNAQAAFVYRYKPPFGTIQIAFQRGTADFGQRSNQGNTIFLKITTVF